MSFQINTLRMFCLLAEKLSFTETADILEMSQPTLSRKISQLEQEVKLRLFHRGGNQIHLTPQGIVFLESCQRILQDLDDTIDGLYDTSESIRGEITVGLLHPMGRWLSQYFFYQFKKLQPKIHINLVTLHPTQLREMANCDIMISPLLPTDLSLIAKPILKYRRVFCASPKYLARYGTPEHPAQLTNHQCITNTNSIKRETEWIYEDLQGKIDIVDVSGIITTDSVDIATNLAISGMGIALIPEDQISKQLAEGRLIQLFHGNFGQNGQIYAVYRSRKYLPTRIRVFMEELQNFLNRTDASDLLY
ncbi:LysR family transcriptional regulator [Aliivibrio finisterrensis]|uniref:LysR family transcriptional regulator n=1 Tax=Aliivibrio finisterrensis TaxID=511998 RepID=UPI00101E95AC|nr:LysR family transcriptional regulator [Aliivibrio finisterrensis]RYU67033.1 LysR family transcriptional regulator [Aliivibrio finisterrensis]RYU70259.1 LysR family transcriptional regulator [Aliivibrio finisterrensis]RYU72397.1 LysR family transcriptional regulator [Aliivibrio finisterrensis]